MNKRSLRSSYSDYAGRGNYDQVNISRAGPQRTRKRVPPEQTHAENYYYRKQMEARTPMAVVLNDGETILGTIEWYDKKCIKIHRNGEPNLLVFKHNIKYLFKQEKKADVSPPAQKARVKAAATKPVEVVEEEVEA